MQIMRSMFPTVVVAISLMFLALSPCKADDLECRSGFERPSYPRLAILAAIQGKVMAHVTIGPNGVPNGTYEGTGILVQAVKTSVERTRLGHACEGKSYHLSYRFEFEGEESYQPMTTMSFIPPAEYLIRTNPTGTVCILRSEVASKGKSKAPVVPRR